MQGLEHRSGDVPVKIVRLQVQRVSVGQQVAQSLDDQQAVSIGKADINRGSADSVADMNTPRG